jgi:carbon monoxide dehydrogenase subunit G
MDASASIVIDRPIHEVFRGLSDVPRLDQWMEGVSNPQVPGGEPLNLGGTFTTEYTTGRRTAHVVYQVTVLDPPHRFAFKAIEGPFAFKGHLECIGLGGSTQVHYLVDVGSDGLFTTVLFALMGPLLRSIMARRLHRDLERLRALFTPTAAPKVPTYVLHETRLAA